MSVIRGVAGLFYSIVCLLTVVACLLCYGTFTSHWIGGFLMMALPVLMVIHLIVMVAAAFTGNSLWIRSFLLIALFYPMSSRLYVSNGGSSNSEDKESTLKVISFNVMRFDERKIFYDNTRIYESEFKSWLKDQDADILFIQEYNNKKGGDKNKTWTWFKELGYHYFVGQERDPHSLSGPVIISKYPLFQRDYVDFGSLNGLVSANVVVKSDTFSLVNVHLYSMTLKLGDVLKQKNIEAAKSAGKVTVDKIKEGWDQRKFELVDIERKINDSPYPVILCGDFNETPFSYIYGKVSKLLDNAFETKGDGFGFTYNLIPYFIRIDNQFYDAKSLEVISFETASNVKFSDHYPLIGTYRKKP